MEKRRSVTAMRRTLIAAIVVGGALGASAVRSSGTHNAADAAARPITHGMARMGTQLVPAWFAANGARPDGGLLRSSGRGGSAPFFRRQRHLVPAGSQRRGAAVTRRAITVDGEARTFRTRPVDACAPGLIARRHPARRTPWLARRLCPPASTCRATIRRSAIRAASTRAPRGPRGTPC